MELKKTIKARLVTRRSNELNNAFKTEFIVTEIREKLVVKNIYGRIR